MFPIASGCSAFIQLGYYEGHSGRARRSVCSGH
jgi:hypothetical protein